MYYLKIKQLIDEKNFSIKDVCHQIGISEQGLHTMIRNRSMKIDILEKIADLLDVSINYFFCEDSYDEKIFRKVQNHCISEINKDIEIYKRELEASMKEIQYLKEKLQDKIEIIDLLKRQQGTTNH